LCGQESHQRNHPHSAARFAGALRFSDNARARELAILKKSEDRSNNSRPVFVLLSDAPAASRGGKNRARRRFCFPKNFLHRLSPRFCGNDGTYTFFSKYNETTNVGLVSHFRICY
jgi:hypothetical protein